ncbi:hypothetical protein BDV29DRAFT_57269 [Aspergillus leporis]|uniref:Myb-like domain-containing protein n=1 Tax=Aspergillus leporis TaxID=41062 RepID=A0A5N5WKZ4_9EURO|nr:hypothetical protein BDV29DRAFT_57269 [Aspergillus leporis]
MDRQISYNGPLAPSLSSVPKSQFGTSSFSSSPLPCNFPSSLPSGPMNHPLPPKPPTSKYVFHAYIPPPCAFGIPPGNHTARRIDRSECLPVNSESKCSSSGQQASAIGTLGAPETECVILPSGEETSKELQSDRDEMSSVDMNIDDFPQPDTLFFWARKNGDAPSRKSSISPRCVDDGICHAATNSATSEIPETGPFSSESLVGANDEDGHMNLMLDKGEPSIRHSTENSRPPASRKRLACATLETGVETTSGPRTRARVKSEARAEASPSFPTSRRVQPYSTAEDELLGKLVARGLPWEQIEKEFGQVFPGRNVRSLQLRWSRNLKSAARSTRCSKRRAVNNGLGRRCL